ncbi:cbb3-type cytochrome oxidase assembly protein CcoS [Microbulbifer celer]|uniref:Cbb3-type cytochrome oxidase assembly protein CcoS n=1 Tax=Microbulbifer celer TaxID=435905 RepID=A0ABW3U4T5_9GAMM|nr:cbb3-type cytochrome oxidase assembly protein CcoS [Microbulbifer celer]UFN58192.1 cbb3-type cytochrome oxidase assembly protein CcoS [Microbulbifer celer]
MDSLFLLVPIVIFFIVCAVKLFFWAVNSGQYDDLETEGRRILFDDDEPAERPREEQKSSATRAEQGEPGDKP